MFSFRFLLVDFGSFHSCFDNVINDSFNYTVTRHRWNLSIEFSGELLRLFMFLLIFNEQRVPKYTYFRFSSYLLRKTAFICNIDHDWMIYRKHPIRSLLTSMLRKASIRYPSEVYALFFDTTCVFIRFHSVKNANMQLIWSSGLYGYCLQFIVFKLISTSEFSQYFKFSYIFQLFKIAQKFFLFIKEYLHNFPHWNYIKIPTKERQHLSKVRKGGNHIFTFL